MRNVILTSLCIVAMLSAVSCGNKTKPATAGSSDTTVIDFVPALADDYDLDQSPDFSIRNIELKEKFGTWDYSLSVDYPTSGSESLLQGVRQWIAKQLAPDAVSESAKHFVDNADASLNDGEEVLEFYSRQFKALAEGELDMSGELPEDIQMEYTTEIKQTCGYGPFVTFCSMTYFYGGGAHGSTLFEGASFDANTGERIGWNMIADKKALHKEVVEGLKRNFETESDEQLMSYLLLADENATTADIPLPTSEPFLTEQGLELVYQQYEVACYAAGMPTVIIPWATAVKLLHRDYQLMAPGM